MIGDGHMRKLKKNEKDKKGDAAPVLSIQHSNNLLYQINYCTNKLS